MDSLDKETFSFWTTHPDDLLPTDFQQLQQAVRQYPYCQSLHTLTAKAASVHQKSGAIEWVRTAAAHALSRNALRKLVENEFHWSENLLSRLNELTGRQVPIPEDYQKESYDLLKTRADQQRTFPSFAFFDFPRPGVPDVLKPEPTDDPAAVSVPPVDDSTRTETTLQTDLQQQAQPGERPVPADTVPPERRRQLELIENFIRNEPQISRVRLQPGETSEQEDLTNRAPTATPTLVTESFARILIRQNKVEKAIQVYEQLMVKNPEKKVYFAEKIEELRAGKP